MSNDNKRQQLIDKLKEMFQMDQADLDFGIYRIMNAKRDEITRFLEQDLLPTLRNTLEEFQPAGLADKKKELAEAIENARKLKIDPDSLDVVQQLKAELAEGGDIDRLESQVYSDLYTFFSRYYQDGDFLSLRRYKEGVYALPYEGEEVKLHWANADQYYIKTAENFTRYAFKSGKGRVRFELAAASTERDNNKATGDNERRFILAEDPLAVEDGELIIRFEYRPDAEKRKQKELNAAVVESLLTLPEGAPLATGVNDWPEWRAALAIAAPTEKNKSRSLLEKHLTDYTAKNTFDYFIHKDLGHFLRRELDFFIKNEVMHLDDIESDSAAKVENYLARIKAMRRIAHKMIAFLAQLENFQKKLWLKKKFVLETNWLITLDRIPESLYPEVCRRAEIPVRGLDGRERCQREEWIELFAIDDIKDELPEASAYSVPLSREFLVANRFLVLDTSLFEQDFVERILTSISDIDDQTTGVLVHGDNFQGLSLLEARYTKGVDCIYIDPPYNTDAGPICYKNGYKSSSWISLMHGRLHKSRQFLKADGVIVAAIDDAQQRELSFLLDDCFGNMLGTICVRSNPSGRPTQAGYAVSHEYLIFAGNSIDSTVGRLPPTQEQVARFNQIDDRGAFEWRNLRREGSNSDRAARRALYYPIYIHLDQIRVPKMSWDKRSESWVVEEKAGEGEQVVYPDNDANDQKTWRWEWKTVMSSLNDLAVRRDRSGKDYIYYKRRPNEDGVVSVSSWFDAKYSATEHGTALLKSLFGTNPFSYPKSIHAVLDSIYIAGASNPTSTILDYFGGSGTTAHAVIQLNRRDSGSRKYVLIEQGEYFEYVLKPRVKKAIYSPDWKDGKPCALGKGISTLSKVLKIEGYEDAINNTILLRSDEQNNLIETHDPIREDYILRYMLESESRTQLLGLERFVDPFSVRMTIARSDETRTVKVDMVETFNYLLGLRVQSMRRLKGVYEVIGTTPQGDRTLILWRDIRETDSDALDDWFRKQAYSSRDREFDLIYVNGDNNLENLRHSDESWKVRLIEEAFHTLMFDVEDV